MFGLGWNKKSFDTSNEKDLLGLSNSREANMNKVRKEDVSRSIHNLSLVESPDDEHNTNGLKVFFDIEVLDFLKKQLNILI